VVLLRGSPTLPPQLTTIEIGSRPCSIPVRQITTGRTPGIDPCSGRDPEKSSSTEPHQQEQSNKGSIPHLASNRCGLPIGNEWRRQRDHDRTKCNPADEYKPQRPWPHEWRHPTPVSPVRATVKRLSSGALPMLCYPHQCSSKLPHFWTSFQHAQLVRAMAKGADEGDVKSDHTALSTPRPATRRLVPGCANA
jgi:hypothetical protein